MGITGEQITVLIPNYNRAKYLSRCLDSVFAQTMLPKEVIVRDDSSTDGSLELLHKYEQNNQRLIVISHPRETVLKARNFLLRTVKTEWCIFLDSDDFFYHQNAIESLAQFASDGVFPFGNYILVSEDGNPREPEKTENVIFERSRMSVPFLLSRIDLTHVPRCALMQVRRLLALGGYTKEVWEDLDVIIKLLLDHVEFKGINITASAYRDVPVSLSKTQRDLGRDCIVAIERETHPVLSPKERTIFRQLKRRAEKEYRKEHRRDYWRNKSPIRCFVRAVAKMRNALFK